MSRAVISLVAGLALVACQGGERAQLVVVVHTDLRVPDELQSIQLRVSAPDDGDRVVHEQMIAVGPGGETLPFSFGVAPAGGDVRRRARIDVEGRLGETVVVSTHLISSFVRGKRVQLDVYLLRRCIDVMCPTGQVCGLNGCQDAEVDPATLPEFDPRRACDSVLQTGCGAGQGCYIDPEDGRPYCANAGAVPMGGACSEATDCAPGLDCYQGDCVELCSTDADCTGGTACIDPTRPGEPERVAGVCVSSCTDCDGGVPDAGVPDAGAPDAGVSDAGVPDAGPTDGGTPGDPTIALATGDAHTCVVRRSGGVLCWGSNMNGQLGDGTRRNSAVPVVVMGVTDAIDVAAGGDHTCVIHATGTASCWGDNLNGQLGDGTGADRFTAGPVPGLTGVTFIAAGAGHTCAVHGGGQVSCWGSGSVGQIGDGATMERQTPTPIALTDGVSLALGYGFSCARRSSGALSCWGNDFDGQLGDGRVATLQTMPVAVSGVADAVDLSAGWYHACAVRGTGAAICWGDNQDGDLGDGSTMQRNTPVAVSGIDDATAITSGQYFGCALRSAGAVWCWGNNVAGQLGNGSTAGSTTPVAVTGLVGATLIAAGTEHACALAAGTVSCWGSNMRGQLGDGTTTGRLTPTPVALP